MPNPDPSDTAEWNNSVVKQEAVIIDEAFENERGNLRRQAQEWAGLTVDPDVSNQITSMFYVETMDL